MKNFLQQLGISLLVGGAAAAVILLIIACLTYEIVLNITLLIFIVAVLTLWIYNSFKKESK